MKTLLFVAVATLTAAAWQASPTPDDLVGSWQVDLRPSPDAPAYYQEFVVSSAGDGALSGVFYGSGLQFGRVNADWDGVHFAFVTIDRSSRYVTTGRLVGDRLEGVTYSPDRDLLQPWSAERSPVTD